MKYWKRTSAWYSRSSIKLKPFSFGVLPAIGFGNVAPSMRLSPKRRALPSFSMSRSKPSVSSFFLRTDGKWIAGTGDANEKAKLESRLKGAQNCQSVERVKGIEPAPRHNSAIR